MQMVELTSSGGQANCEAIQLTGRVGRPQLRLIRSGGERLPERSYGWLESMPLLFAASALVSLLALRGLFGLLLDVWKIVAGS